MAAQANNNYKTDMKGGYTLAIVPFLNSADNWLDFLDGIKTFLIINNQLNWLNGHLNKLTGGNQERE